MEPTIPDGSIVIVHQQPEVEDGEIAAVQMHSDGADTDEATLKRVKHANGEVLLMPDKGLHPYRGKQKKPCTNYQQGYQDRN